MDSLRVKMENNKTSIARRFKAWRISNGMTQQQAAVELGRSVKTIANWESGRTTPPKMIEKIIK